LNTDIERGCFSAPFFLFFIAVFIKCFIFTKIFIWIFNAKAMKTNWFSIAVFFIVILCSKYLTAQGLPPGWNYTSTPSQHIISIQLSVNPNINGYPLKPGDWIGVFYINDSGNMACGGAVEWTGTQNTGIMANGNDSFTPEKDGFANGELMNYKVYSWSVEKQYDAVVTCNDGLPSTCLNFVPSGLSGLASLVASGFYLIAEASDDTICSGNTVQLNAIPSGGSGAYSFNWSSFPPGFSSSLQNPIANPTVSTVYYVQVTNSGETLTATVGVTVVPSPQSDAGQDQTICSNENAQLNGNTNNAASFIWSTAGDGSFSNPSVLNPTYYPGASDINSGIVELCLTATGNPPCAGQMDCMNLVLLPLPDVSLAAYPSYCVGDNPFPLFGGLPPGGTYYINGLPSTLFDPAEAGIFELIYQYTDGSGCTNTASGEIVVNALPQIECPDDFTVCCDNGPIVLNMALPAGGIYSGEGVVDNVFYPDCFSIGSVEINYTWVDPVTNCQNECSFVIYVAPLPDVTCPDGLEICENVEQYPLTGGNPSGGNYSGNGVIMNVFYPPLAGIGIHQMSYTYFDENGCSNNCSFSIQVKPVPSVNAGFPVVYIIYPEISIVLSDATASNFITIGWTTTGTGNFDDPTIINPVYTFSDDDIQAGSVTLTMAGENECGIVTDDILVIMNECQPALVDAGNDTTICEDVVFHITDADAHFYSFLYWSKNEGDGAFDDSTLLHPHYTPGPNDILYGAVMLTLTAFPLEPCDTISDSMVLSIVKLPTVVAGDDQTVCEDHAVALSGSASNFSSSIWSTGGDGQFENATNLQTIYFLGSNDIISQQVNLTLSVNPFLPCVGDFNDYLNVSITPIPTVDAGEDVTIYPDDQLQLNASATNYQTVLWSSSGDGVFSADNVPDPVYFPGMGDIQNASALLTISIFPIDPCTVIAEDSLELTIDTLTNINFVYHDRRFGVFPNPATGVLFIEANGYLKGETFIEIYNLNGRKVMSHALNITDLHYGDFYRLDIENLTNGLFLVWIRSGYFSFSEKVLIAKP
jgi:hypothetical protein